MVSLPLVPLLYSILHILAIIIVRMDNPICMFLMVDCSCPGPWSLVLGHPGPLWFGSWSSVALWALDSCAYAFPMLLIPVESVFCWHPLPAPTTSLPTSLTPWLNWPDSPKSYSKSPTFSSVIGLCLPLQPMCPQCPHICIIFQSHWTTDFQVPCVDSFFWSEIDHFPLWTAGKLASLALTLASLWNFFWFPKQEMITPYTTGFLTHLEF